jgi:lambda family phage tail tape measure protein
VSLGLGRRQQQLNQGIAQIEDRYTGQRQDLENNKARLELEGKFTADAKRQYDERLALIETFQAKSIDSYTAYFNELTRLQGDWSLGANSAIADYITESQDLFTQTSDLVKDSLKGMEDALVEFVMTGKLSFADLANTIVAEITRIIIKQQISNMLGVAGSAGGGFFSDFIGSLLTPGKRANGGLVSAGGLYQVNEEGPELLTLGGRQYLMMGNQSGQVTPNLGSPSITNVIQVNVPATAMGSRATANQYGAEVGQQIRRAMARNS